MFGAGGVYRLDTGIGNVSGKFAKVSGKTRMSNKFVKVSNKLIDVVYKN